VIETTALGAGYLAGLATGFWKDKSEIYENWNCNREFVPMLSADDAKKRIKGWNRAVKAALYWAEESLEEECNEGEQ
jgi:glycerol kinase